VHHLDIQQFNHNVGFIATVNCRHALLSWRSSLQGQAPRLLLYITKWSYAT